MSTLFVSGDPGSGKSTWARGLAEAVGWAYLSTGDELRRRGQAARLASEPFGDDGLVRSIVEEALRGPPGCVVDGFPRKPEQVQLIEHWVRSWKVQARVVWFEASVGQVLARYSAAGYARSARSGKYGPRGEVCPAGGVYELPISEHYMEKRSGQEASLGATLELLSFVDIPLVVRGRELG